MKTTSFLLLSCAALALAGCGDVREDLGLGRSAPDEFAVVDRPPLSMPPDYTLRPPQPGAPRPQDVDPSKSASNIMFGGKTGAPDKPVGGSGAEQALLANSGAVKADPDIRDTVDKEASEKVAGTEHLVDDLLWWRHDNDQPGTAVDPAAEAARIKAAKEKGEPLNKSATPVIEREKSGWLGL